MNLKNIISQALLLARDLSYQDRGMKLSDAQAQNNLKIVGELLDMLHNIPEILCDDPNEFLAHLFICKLKNFLLSYPQYNKYFEYCLLSEK